jgi:beta-glucosidase-like glycosyl hydrolase
MMKTLFSILVFILVSSIGYAQRKPDFVTFINQEHAWVDSVFNALTPKERIAQLFLVRAHTNLGQKYIDSVGAVVEKEQLGGLVVFQGGPVRHVDMFNQYQKKAKVPLLITFDGEWGVGMRLPDSTLSFPYQMTLGAIQDDRLLYDMGREVAKDFIRMGMHFNFAPVVDINNNPKNPVINFRSFGDNKFNVTNKAKRYMQGMVDGGIIASLKHFPGHGDTDVDSHYDLPQLNFSRERLEDLEMYPFRELIKAGAPAVMVAHMHIPALDNTANIPSSISRKVVTGILRDELGFEGLAVTDAMDMKGVKKFFPNGEADIKAIEAGNDLLEISENSARAISLVEQSINNGRLKQQDIDRRVKKVLAAKYWLGLNN